MLYNYRKAGYGDWRNAWMMTEIKALLLKNIDEFEWVCLGNLQLPQSSFELAHFECKCAHLRTVSHLFLNFSFLLCLVFVNLLCPSNFFLSHSLCLPPPPYPQSVWWITHARPCVLAMHLCISDFLFWSSEPLVTASAILTGMMVDVESGRI